MPFYIKFQKFQGSIQFSRAFQVLDMFFKNFQGSVATAGYPN